MGNFIAFLIPTNLYSRAAAIGLLSKFGVNTCLPSLGYDTVRALNLPRWTLCTVTAFIAPSHPYKSPPLFTVPLLPPLAFLLIFVHFTTVSSHFLWFGWPAPPSPMYSKVHLDPLAAMVTQVAFSNNVPKVCLDLLFLFRHCHLVWKLPRSYFVAFLGIQEPRSNLHFFSQLLLSWSHGWSWSPFLYQHQYFTHPI
jgi:hypothetical protein